MRFVIFVIAAALASGAAPRASSAQSLAEIAAKEKERRKGKAGKVITEDDLRSASQGVPSGEPETSTDADATAEEGASPAPGAAQGAKPEKTDDEKKAEKQAALQKEVDAERAHIEGIKRDIALREAELNDLSNYTFGGRRADLAKFVDDAKQAIVTHEAQVAKLVEQGRREGMLIR
jgi:hypothetical protein